MAGIRQTRTGSWELTLRNKLLPKTLYFTFATKQDAEDYATEAEKWLAAGIVPEVLKQKPAKKNDAVRLSTLIREWRDFGRLSRTDNDILGWLSSDTKLAITLDQLTYTWAEDWVESMKLQRNLAPSSIRKRVQSVSKAISWYLRKNPKAMSTNPLTLLPRGYSVYTESDAKILSKVEGKCAKRDVARDRRLHEGEVDKIREVLRGERKLYEHQAGPLVDKDISTLFEVIYYTGLRLREAYTIRKEFVNLTSMVVKVKTTKQRNGHIAYRDVPIRPELYPIVRNYMTQGEGLLFPFWDGNDDTLTRTSNRLSHRFATVFQHAGCDGLTEHDLRHEATCQWYELRDEKGGWLFRPEEINKIMGWAPGSTMGTRYASFRSVSLAERLWSGVSVPD